MVEGHEHTELLMVYDQAVGDIERAKQWGWQLTYSAVLTQFGLLALARGYQPRAPWVNPFFAILLAAVGLAATAYIRGAQRSLDCFRKRLGACRKQLCQRSIDLLGDIPKKPQWPSTPVVWVSSAVTVFLLLGG